MIYTFDIVHTYEVKASSKEDAVEKIRRKYPHRQNSIFESKKEILYITTEEDDKGQQHNIAEFIPS